jgi:hypothetical protein
MIAAKLRSLRKEEIKKQMLIYRHLAAGCKASKQEISVALRFHAHANSFALPASPQQLASANMASVEAIHWVSHWQALHLRVACSGPLYCRTQVAAFVAIMPLQYLLPLSAALVILSSLQLHWTSGKGDPI